ncbi:MAG: oxidoreductase [Comamonadaceae bacterium]|uniref:PDR/VanB family oxidoreductase n=1 Tax=Hydrogenophaga sp. SNF1 TaxID=3098762 RepID=UPI002ACBEF6A|nr:PDR/VanB family oxidoreductase [Hydrogenophaga sp. SNF1]NCT97478.1 oxidoreductase [Comamonadaceae bacterium]WQB83308.1 PDR/VanB family oxidoreductase [Hydrogenophaga sp. SNF1]
MKLRVRSITHEAEGILSFDLVDPAGAPLPAFEAGAHLDVRVPGTSMSRRYSLCGPTGDTRRWRIAVLRVAHSRGGSRAMHERVRPGDLLEVSGPHNFFPLQEQAERSLLLAGGIGVTPLLAMLHRLRALGRPVVLHYCAQSPERTAFRELLEPLVGEGLVHFHHDNGDPRTGLDIEALLRQAPDGTHLYYCGPGGFMQAVQRASAHWPEGSVHCEYFGAEPAAPAPSVAPGAGDGDGVPVRLLRSDRTLRVRPAQTLLQALREAGVDCPSSCEAGVCGTCQVAYRDGTPEHNDLILSEEERASQVLVCCARAREPFSLDI